MTDHQTVDSLCVSDNEPAQDCDKAYEYLRKNLPEEVLAGLFFDQKALSVESAKQIVETLSDLPIYPEDEI